MEEKTQILLNKFADYSIGIFGVCGLALLLGKREWFPSFYWPAFMAGAAFVSALILVASKRIFNSANPAEEKAKLWLKGAITLALWLNALGAAGLFQLYRVGFEFDKLVHFSVAGVLALSGAFYFQKARGFTWGRSMAVAAALVFIGEIAWEMLEFLSDYFLKTTSLGLSGSRVIQDTIMDVVFNVAGIIAGSIIYVSLKQKNKTIKK